MRRRKIDLEMMKDDITLYLLKNDNNPHEAWNNFIKDNLMNHSAMPYYIKGIKDFIKVSKDIESKSIIEEKERTDKQQYKILKDGVINSIQSVDKDYAKILWNDYRKVVNENEKITLFEIVSMILEKEYYIDSKHINFCLKYNLV